MKLSLKIFILIYCSFINVFGADLKVEKVKLLGVLKHKVIYQEQSLTKMKDEKVYTGKLIAKSDNQVYEVVEGFYTCDSKNSCRLVDNERIATFESCSVLDIRKAVCHTLLSKDSNLSDDNDSEVSVSFGGKVARSEDGESE